MARCCTSKAQRKYFIVGGVTLLYSTIEIAVALGLGSLALFSDGVHNLSDVAAVGISFWSDRFSDLEASDNMTYGWKRTQLLGAFTNGLFLLALSFFTILQAIPMFFQHDRAAAESRQIAGVSGHWWFIGIAASGVAINTFGTVLFGGHTHSHGVGDGHGHSHGGGHGHSHGGGHGHSHGGGHGHFQKADKSGHPKAIEEHGHALQPLSVPLGYTEFDIDIVALQENQAVKYEQKKKKHVDMNMLGVYLHYLGDAFSSTLILIIGVLGYFLHGMWIVALLDPFVSVVICLVIVWMTLPMVKQVAGIFLQQTPEEISLPKVREHVLTVEGIKNVHHLHIWRLVGSVFIASVHIVIDSKANFKILSDRVKEVLHTHGVHSSTVQPDYLEEDDDDETHSVEAYDCTTNCVKDCKDDPCCKKAV